MFLHLAYHSFSTGLLKYPPFKKFPKKIIFWIYFCVFEKTCTITKSHFFFLYFENLIKKVKMIYLKQRVVIKKTQSIKNIFIFFLNFSWHSSVEIVIPKEDQCLISVMFVIFDWISNLGDVRVLQLYCCCLFLRKVSWVMKTVLFFL